MNIRTICTTIAVTFAVLFYSSPAYAASDARGYLQDGGNSRCGKTMAHNAVHEGASFFDEKIAFNLTKDNVARFVDALDVPGGYSATPQLASQYFVRELGALATLHDEYIEIVIDLSLFGYYCDDDDPPDWPLSASDATSMASPPHLRGFSQQFAFAVAVAFVLVGFGILVGTVRKKSQLSPSGD